MKKIIFVLMGLILFSSCVAVKEYEKVHINDPDMVLSDKYIKTFHSYRESVVGAKQVVDVVVTKLF